MQTPLTHNRAVAAGHSNIAEADPYVHTVRQRGVLLSDQDPRPHFCHSPDPNKERGKESEHRRPPQASLLVSPHQTKRPPAQLGCSRSMALGAMNISWETWRTGLALGIESPLGRKGERARLGMLCRTRCETGIRSELQSV